MRSRMNRHVTPTVVFLGIAMGFGVVGCSAGDPQITAKAAFFSDQITGANEKYVQALPSDEDKLGADICRILVTTGSDSVVELSWHRAVDSLVALGYADAEARQMITDGTAAYCPTKSAGAAAALAKASDSPAVAITTTG